MIHSLPYLIALLTIGVALIVVLTARFKLPAFFALLAACLLVGTGAGLSLTDVLAVIREGFGKILQSLGLLIVLGTALGVLLEHSRSTTVIAGFLARLLGRKRATLAMSLTGFIVGLPVFCDSGFIVLSGLNRAMIRRTGIARATLSTALATGLYAIHCLVPPHPGSVSAAVTLGADMGRLLALGTVVALPPMIAGYAWARFAGKHEPDGEDREEGYAEETAGEPSLMRALLPVIVPITLIAMRSFIGAGQGNALSSILATAGDPPAALLIGLLLALNCGSSWSRSGLGKLLQEAVEKGGAILMVIGMGGAFGAVLAATQIGGQISHLSALQQMGLFFPFLVAAVLKTAQGSSTVAIMTAATLVLPLTGSLGLDSANGKIWCVLSMGSGSMMVSHVNDAYFWVVSRFSGMGMKTTLKVYSVATIWMGLTAFAMVYLLSKII